MKTIIIYTSQTGFTERYAKWLAEEVSGEILTLEEAKKKNEDYFANADAIVYGGWAMGGKFVHSEWFTERIPSWKGKKLVLMGVGASPNEFPDVGRVLDETLTDEQKKYAKAFYCQGGLAYDKMKLPSRLAMKAFASMVSKKKDATPDEIEMGKMISKSYDIADKKYLEPIKEYLLQ